ncbi:hypothetical protein EX30DRAFT_249857 [Ascodesmis nigricans]|uniref:Uncharacterized protein n=1 Tax=Ascodesmis nigricans TaxID=341454 RepID=A0A4S2MY56_9PEZI|nr:hypothetical protein EX30DRAFT_249857 [Ascodesmis nigricans]
MFLYSTLRRAKSAREAFFFREEKKRLSDGRGWMLTVERGAEKVVSGGGRTPMPSARSSLAKLWLSTASPDFLTQLRCRLSPSSSSLRFVFPHSSALSLTHPPHRLCLPIPPPLPPSPLFLPAPATPPSPSPLLPPGQQTTQAHRALAPSSSDLSAGRYTRSAA